MKLFVALLFLLSGCATLFYADEPKVARHPIVKPAPREKGSVWSEDSRWNTLYASQASRLTGDHVRIKLTENLKRELARLVDNPEDTEGKPNGDTLSIEAIVREVMPRGMLIVMCNQRIKISGREVPILLEGILRDKDIASDDTVSSDLLYNVIVKKNEESNEMF